MKQKTIINKCGLLLALAIGHVLTGPIKSLVAGHDRGGLPDGSPAQNATLKFPGRLTDGLGYGKGMSRPAYPGKSSNLGVDEKNREECPMIPGESDIYGNCETKTECPVYYVCDGGCCELEELRFS